MPINATSATTIRTRKLNVVRRRATAVASFSALRRSQAANAARMAKRTTSTTAIHAAAVTMERTVRAERSTARSSEPAAASLSTTSSCSADAEGGEIDGDVDHIASDASI